MKKFTFLLLAFAIAGVSFAQKQNIKLNKPIPADAERAEWFGNTDLASLDIVDTGYEYAIIFTAGELSAGDDITKVKFYSDATTYAAAYGINNTSYTIKIYEGGSFDAATGYDVITANGTEVYSEDYTAATDGWQEVELATPYTIGTGEFWVSIYCNGVSAVFMGGADPTSNGKYVITRYDSDADEDYWSNNEYCTDASCTDTEYDPWCLAVYVDDGGVYVENSDLYSLFFEGSTSPYTPMTETSIAGDEDLVLYPAMGNAGPDDTDNMVNISVTVDGTSYLDEDIDMSSATGTPLENGYFTWLAPDPYSVTITAAELDAASATGTFDVCLTVTYAGVDNVADNNEACVSVTRGTVGVINATSDIISVYPNPTTNIINIANAENETILVINMIGEIVKTVENASANQSIDISNLAKGTYFVKVNSEMFKINIVE